MKLSVYLLSYIVATYLIRNREYLQRSVSVIQETPHGGELDLFPICPLFYMLMLLSSSDVGKWLSVALVLQMILIRKISILENDYITA